MTSIDRYNIGELYKQFYKMPIKKFYGCHYIHTFSASVIDIKRQVIKTFFVFNNYGNITFKSDYCIQDLNIGTELKIEYNVGAFLNSNLPFKHYLFMYVINFSRLHHHVAPRNIWIYTADVYSFQEFMEIVLHR